MRPSGLRWLVPALIGLPALPAFACTPPPGYRTPTNFELVQKADLIVLARVVDGPDDPFGERAFVAIEPVRVLKGTVPGDPLRIHGSLKWNGRTVPSMPTPLASAHFSTGMGACIRLFYPKGGLIVAMFQRTDVSDKHAHPYSMTPLFEPLSRSAEDVESADGVWVKAVETYVAMQAGGGASGLPGAVEKKRAELLSRSDDPGAQAMADDLAYYLDQTGAGGPPVHNEGLHWRMIDLPDESAAIVGDGKEKARILRCRAGGPGLEVYWPEEEGAAKALRIGARRFALVPADLTLSPEMKSHSATVKFDAALREAMTTSGDDAGVEMTTRTVAAPPLDIIGKFALRCEALLKAPLAS